MSKIVCVASGKGGVGKTTSVVNLGSALNKFGYDTIIVDGNISTPDLGMHLGMPTEGTNLHDVLKNQRSIYESVYLHPNGTKIVPSGINMWGLIDLSRNKLDKIKKLKNYCNVILLDCAPGITGDAEECIKVSDEVLVVTEPMNPSVTDALKTIALAKKYGKKVIGAIINKRLGEDYEMTDENVEEYLGVPILSVVPDDTRVRKSLGERKAIVDVYPSSKPSISFKRAAARVVGQDYKDLDDRGFFGKLIGLFKK